jgi:anaerobic magnesium-protoporphyrin IX monomethyl ester cyclase
MIYAPGEDGPRVIRETFGSVVLVNPNWDFTDSSYWACRDTHLPLELLYSQSMLLRSNVHATLIDAHLEQLSTNEVAGRVKALQPGLVVVTTAPTYLFWRCPQPELTVPAALSFALREIAPVLLVGPHGSATPSHALDVTGADAVLRGEPEEELLRLALGQETSAVLWQADERGGEIGVAVTDPRILPALDYSGYPLEKRAHRHHVFWGEGRGAEVEASRGCPYQCSFCNRRYFRSRYRQRPVEPVLEEMRRLLDLGIDYVYFIDEVFGLPGSDGLLRALEAQPILPFGCQTRLDLWDETRLDRLASAGCISLEFGLESPFPEVQAALRKGSEIGGGRAIDLMAYAKSRIPWVQADLVLPPDGNPVLLDRTEEWRQEAISRGIWVSEPVKLFAYPGSALFDQIAGPVDESAWVRAQQLAVDGEQP